MPQKMTAPGGTNTARLGGKVGSAGCCLCVVGLEFSCVYSLLGYATCCVMKNVLKLGVSRVCSHPVPILGPPNPPCKLQKIPVYP